MERNIRKCLVADFDETITEQDTTMLIASLAKREEEMESRWHQHAEEYYKNWKDIFHNELHRHSQSLDKSCKITKRIKRSALQFRGLEQSCWKKTIDEEFLKGIKREDLYSTGRNLPLRKGALKTLHRAQNHRFEIGIISINWSRDLIVGALESTGEIQAEDVFLCSNNLGYENDLSTGYLSNHLMSGIDKTKYLKELRRRKCEEEEETLIIYVGDSVTDILPALNADVGILICPKQTTRDYCDSFGIKLLDLNDFNKKDFFNSRKKHLWFVSCWKTIKEKIVEPNDGSSYQSVQMNVTHPPSTMTVA
eukprot:TRINITY_DN286_c0_g1_i1.p1 TRINITY_DN286_c0_g1~~TRINITY_DN286_c0_g1_i1.p1  ORF type:complete len:308 (-),score=98.33 TRINITY_DN286_c0_g1_i1:107-1030(-)